jgi:hypothetical protein
MKLACVLECHLHDISVFLKEQNIMKLIDHKRMEYKCFTFLFGSL